MKRMRQIRRFLSLGVFILMILFLSPLSGAGAGETQNAPKLECPKDMKVLLKKYKEAYNKLLALMGTGEGGKMDTPQTREAARRYRFYADCLKRSGGSRSDANTATTPPSDFLPGKQKRCAGAIQLW